MTTITQIISDLGALPDIADPSTFEARMNALITAAFPTLRTEINTWRGQANTMATELAALAAISALLVGPGGSVAAARAALSLGPAALATLQGTNDFRLSLTTGLPVTTADVTGAATVYATPKTGNQIGLYSGGAWALYSSAEFSLSLAGLTTGKPFDVFAYVSGTTPTLESLVWTNDSTRATALAFQDGVRVKSGDATRRYLGTFYTTGTGTTEDSVAKRNLWNYYHRVRRDLLKTDATSTWNYTLAAFRQANGSTANQVEAMIGLAEDAIEIEVNAMTENSAGTNPASVGIGVDSTTVNSSVTNQQGLSATATRGPVSAKYRAIPAAGRHVYAWLEQATASGTQAWYGTSTNVKSAIHGSVMS